MGVKLRNSVKCVATPQGVLFGLDELVHVTGRNVAPYFERLRPMLDGRHSVDEICAAAAPHSRAAVGRILESLRTAEMIYESGREERLDCSSDLEPRWQAYIARYESQCDEVAKVLSRFARTPMKVYGSAPLHGVILEAAAAVGLPAPMFEALDACTVVKDGQGQPAVQMRLETQRSKGESDELAIVALEGYGSADWPGLIDPAMARSRIVVGFIVGRQVLLIWPMDTHAPECSECVAQTYDAADAPGGSALGPAQRRHAIRLGVRLLIQKAMDIRCGFAGAERLLEVDMSTLRIETRRKPLAVSCRHAGARWRPASLSHVLGQRPKVSAEDLVASLSKRLVDAKTGLVVELSEGSLLQVPRHQAAAKVRIAGMGSSVTFITESAADPVDARFEVLKRALELAAADALRNIPLDAFLRVHGWKGAESTVIRRGDLPAGVVVAGVTLDEVAAQAFFRASALYASTAPVDWEAIALDAEFVPEEDRAVLAYLCESRRHARVRAERCRADFFGGCEVMRFGAGDRWVSIVAGEGGQEAFKIGLQDLWLDASVPDVQRNMLERVYPRLRCSAHAHERLFALMQSACETLETQVRLIRLPWLSEHEAEPLLCCYGYVEGSRGAGSEVLRARL